MQPPTQLLNQLGTAEEVTIWHRRRHAKEVDGSENRRELGANEQVASIRSEQVLGADRHDYLLPVGSRNGDSLIVVAGVDQQEDRLLDAMPEVRCPGELLDGREHPRICAWVP
jgi:hypothetical protein